MKKYSVSVTKIQSGFVEVEASNEHEAIEKVQSMNPDLISFDSNEFTADFATKIYGEPDD